MPSLQELEDMVQDTLHSSLDLPYKISETVYSYTEAIYAELTKYGSPVTLPTLKQIEDHLPRNPFSKGCCAMSSTPPPPPPPQGVWQHSVNWLSRNQRTVQVAGGVLCLGIGTTLAYQGGHLWVPGLGRKRVQDKATRRLRQPLHKNGVRKEAVVVIGADTPLGRALAVHLSTLGFIVIVSVSSQSALSAFNSIIPPSSRGYMKALLFETSDVASSLGKFTRSVDEVLKLRFPLLSAGDPYAAPGDEVTLVATINALSYVAPSTEHSLTAGPFNSFQSRPEELAEALERHVVASLSALSSLQPLLTAVPPRGAYKASTDSSTASEAMPSAATAITLLSSPSSHTSLPGAGKESVIAQAVAAGMETLRREAEDRAGRESTLSLPGAASKRTLRVTTVEIDEGLPWGYLRPSMSAERQSKTEGEAMDASMSTTPNRPSFPRRSSSALWPVRDNSTQLVLSKISTILLEPLSNSRLKSRYRVYLPTEGDDTMSGKARRLLNRATQRLMTVIPTSWVDVLLALRRHVSLRRAGLIAQGPRTNRSSSTPGASLASSASREAGRPASGVSPGPASPAHSRRFANNRSQATASGSPLSKARPEFISASSDDGEGYYATSGPPSLPDSNSEESQADAETEDGMLSSGLLSNPSSHYGDGTRRTHYAEGHRSESTARSSALSGDTSGERTASNSLSNSAFSGGNGPWVGPESRESPRAGSPASVPDAEQASQPASQSASSVLDGGLGGADGADVSDSWVRLGESQRLQKDAE